MTQITSAETPSDPSQIRQLFDGVSNKLAVGIELSPEEELFDMRLPEPITAIVAPLLNNIGFRIEESKVVDTISSDEYRYTLAINDGMRRFLLQMPDNILSNPSRDNLRAVNDVLRVFKDNFNPYSRIIIFGWVIPNATYDLIMRQMTDRERIPVEFVPFSKIKDLEKLANHVQEQILRLVLSIELQTVNSRAKEEPQISTIGPDE